MPGIYRGHSPHQQVHAPRAGCADSRALAAARAMLIETASAVQSRGEQVAGCARAAQNNDPAEAPGDAGEPSLGR